MEKSDFLNTAWVTYADTCKKIIELKGDCSSIECDICPFSYDNVSNGKECYNNGYSTVIDDQMNADINHEDKILVKSCNDFISMLSEKHGEKFVALITVEEKCQFVIDISFPFDVGELVTILDDSLETVKGTYTLNIGTISDLDDLFIKEDMEYKYKIRQRLVGRVNFVL